MEGDNPRCGPSWAERPDDSGRQGKFQEKKSNGRQGILGQIGNGLALVETKRKENGLLKECGPKSSWAIEKSFFELFSRILIQNKEI
jgi:hypothetical protein